jgi:hypothetical protein
LRVIATAILLAQISFETFSSIPQTAVEGRQSEARASNLFTIFLASTPDLERFFLVSKCLVPPCCEKHGLRLQKKEYTTPFPPEQAD